MNCPICNDHFESDDTFLKHLDFHKSKSILSTDMDRDAEPISIIKKPRSINVTKIFGKERFESLISEKMKNIENIEEMVHRRNFVEQVKKTTAKHPFVYLPYFVNDVFKGKKSIELVKQYSISNHLVLQDIIQKTLNLKEQRYRIQQYNNAFEMNLKIPTWKDKYDIFKNNCAFFADELLEMIFYNILCSFIIVIMMDHNKTGIDKEEIVLNAKKLEDNFDMFKIVDDSLKSKLHKFFDDNFSNIINNVLSDLLDEGVIQRDRNNPGLLIGTISIDTIKDEIINELKFNPGIKNEKSIRYNISLAHPSMKLILGLNVWMTALMELANENIIRLESTSNFRDTSLVFLNEDYERIRRQLHTLDPKSLEFYGRKISPEGFIEELEVLERGDFGDSDDQVTRIAGLVLAESVKLQAPHESILEFDFSTDISNYDFRTEQLQAIEKLNLVINANIFHCKVMLDDILTLKRYDKIKENLPASDQGIVITFRGIPPEVNERLKLDKSIQVINKEGLKIWASITPTIPSRKNAVAKIHFDPVSKIEKKLVRIDLIDYESGLASVLVLPEMKEATVLVRSLQEIDLHTINVDDFETASKNYFDFLCILAKLSPNTFDDGMNAKIVNIHSKLVDLQKNKNPELFGVYPEIPYMPSRSMSLKYVEFDNDIHVEINTAACVLRNNFICKCHHRLNEEHYYTLCKHLVAAINYICIDYSFDWNVIKRNIDKFKRKLVGFQEGNIERIINAIYYAGEPESKQLFKKYLQRYVDID